MSKLRWRLVLLTKGVGRNPDRGWYLGAVRKTGLSQLHSSVEITRLTVSGVLPWVQMLAYQHNSAWSSANAEWVCIHIELDFLQLVVLVSPASDVPL